MTGSLPRRSLAGLLVVAAALTVAACGGGNKKAAHAANVTLGISEAGKSAKYTVPASLPGGLVHLTVTNSGKAPHGAQLVLVEGNHTAPEVVKVVTSNSPKTPDWVRAEGGIGAVPPGGSATADVNLPAGKYVIGDFTGGPNSSGPPGYVETRVGKGKTGSLPATPTRVDAAATGKDRYQWKISGGLKAGVNSFTFKSEGKQAIHLVAAFRVTGKPSLAAIKKFLATPGNAPPPKFVDQSTFANTAVLDGGKEQTTQLHLSKPGEYVLFCPLTDRDGGKSHDQEGLLKTVQVK